VREGRVNLLGDGTQDTAIAGERLQVSKFGAVDTSKLAPHDEYWAWATELAPPVDVDALLGRCARRDRGCEHAGEGQAGTATRENAERHDCSVSAALSVA
jgi:hypothetical protein